MQRRQLIKEARGILDALERSSIIKALEQILSDSENLKNPNMLRSIMNYSVFESNFTDLQKRIIRDFGLNFLTKPDLWTASASNDRARYELTRTIEAAEVFLKGFPALLDYLEPTTTENLRLELKKPKEDQDALQALTVQVGSEEPYISARRLIDAISSVSGLYSVSCSVNNISEDEIKILTIDSGSDKLLEFIGKAKAILSVRKWVVSIWEKVSLADIKRRKENIEVIASALPVFQDIDRMQRDESIPREHAEILRRELIRNATQFFSSGCMTDDMEPIQITPRHLLTSEQKLLTSPKSEPSDSSDVDEPYE